MPLITIEGKAPTVGAAIPRLLKEVRESGALAFDCAPGNIWVVFREIPRGWSTGEESETSAAPPHRRAALLGLMNIVGACARRRKPSPL